MSYITYKHATLYTGDRANAEGEAAGHVAGLTGSFAKLHLISGSIDTVRSITFGISEEKAINTISSFDIQGGGDNVVSPNGLTIDGPICRFGVSGSEGSFKMLVYHF